jgi:hypothetical protein
MKEAKVSYDIRDYVLNIVGVNNFPEEYEISPMPDLKNQGSVGSCVAHATATVLESLNFKQDNCYEPLSTDFIYGLSGILYNTTSGGMYVRDACKIAYDYGDCKKSTISTNTKQPKCSENLKKKLNSDIYDEAKQFKIEGYA